MVGPTWALAEDLDDTSPEFRKMQTNLGSFYSLQTGTISRCDRKYTAQGTNNRKSKG